MFDSYTPFVPTPIVGTTTQSGAVIVAANANPTPGNPSYQIYVKWAKLRVRSISGGSITIGGDTTSTSPTIISASDVGSYDISLIEGQGIPITAGKDLTYTATGSNLDYSIEVGVHKVMTSLG